jgi:hypothetical protein
MGVWVFGHLSRKDAENGERSIYFFLLLLTAILAALFGMRRPVTFDPEKNRLDLSTGVLGASD